jgi:hypothetical protein
MNRERALKVVVGRGGIDLCGWRLSLDDVCEARTSVGDDA